MARAASHGHGPQWSTCRGDRTVQECLTSEASRPARGRRAGCSRPRPALLEPPQPLLRQLRRAHPQRTCRAHSLLYGSGLWPAAVPAHRARRHRPGREPGNRAAMPARPPSRGRPGPLRADRRVRRDRRGPGGRCAPRGRRGGGRRGGRRRLSGLSGLAVPGRPDGRLLRAGDGPAHPGRRRGTAGGPRFTRGEVVDRILGGPGSGPVDSIGGWPLRSWAGVSPQPERTT
jgi:hypothetical protein